LGFAQVKHLFKTGGLWLYSGGFNRQLSVNRWQSLRLALTVLPPLLKLFPLSPFYLKLSSLINNYHHRHEHERLIHD
jgi:hypothetical protein